MQSLDLQRGLGVAGLAMLLSSAAEGGSMYGTMVGGIGSMMERPRVLTPGSMYPYAPILFDYVHRAMPLDAPSFDDGR